MGLTAHEHARRKDAELIAKHLTDQNGRIELDHSEIRAQVLAQFIKKLDGKLKNLQEGEGLLVKFEVDIVASDGKVRGGSGAERNMPEYIEWRQAVYERDNFTCQQCGAQGELNAHHIKAWSGHPELRFELDNGVTLCKSCHAKEHPHLKLM